MYRARVATERGTCDSCGLEADDLAGVHRAYLAPDPAGALVVDEVDGPVERWCGSCRVHYPHEEVASQDGRLG